MEKLNAANLRYIDLSLPIHAMREPISPEELTRGVLEEEAVWPIETYESYVDDTVCQYVKLKTHVKTHIESPWHLNRGGKCLSEFPLDYFVGRMVNFSFDVPAASPITRKMVEDYAGDDLRAGDIVVFHTSMGEACAPAERPVLTPEAARYLIDKGIRLFGQDNSIETGESTGGLRPHDMFLSGGIPLLEMLTNTSKLSQKVAFLCAIPGMIKIQGLDSSTAPVLAIEGVELV